MLANLEERAYFKGRISLKDHMDYTELLLTSFHKDFFEGEKRIIDHQGPSIQNFRKEIQKFVYVYIYYMYIYTHTYIKQIISGFIKTNNQKKLALAHC